MWPSRKKLEAVVLGPIDNVEVENVKYCLTHTLFLQLFAQVFLRFNMIIVAVEQLS